MLIDFFNDKRKGDNNEELVKDLIDQNMNEKQKQPIKPIPSNDIDILSKNELIDKNKQVNNNLNTNNVIKINPDNNKNKKPQKKCGC